MSNHLRAELQRLLEKQKEVDPSSTEYTTLLRNLELLVGSVELFDDVDTFLFGTATTEPAAEEEPVYPPDNVTPFPDPGPRAGDHPAGGKAVEAAPEKAVELPAVEEPEPAGDGGKTYERSDVRAALVQVRRDGGDVKALLREFGVEDFSAFPAARYGELMAKLGKG